MLKGEYIELAWGQNIHISVLQYKNKVYKCSKAGTKPEKHLTRVIHEYINHTVISLSWPVAENSPMRCVREG